MKLKTATLLACIGTGINLLMRIYNFVRLHLLLRGEYASLESDIYSIFYIICDLLILIFFITYYNKQNTKSWKD